MALTDLKIDFMGYRKIAAIISVVLVVSSVANLAINQLNWGLDFTGGTLVEVYYEESVDPESIRNGLDSAGYEGHVVTLEPSAERPGFAQVNGILVSDIRNKCNICSCVNSSVFKFS